MSAHEPLRTAARHAVPDHVPRSRYDFFLSLDHAGKRRSAYRLRRSAAFQRSSLLTIEQGSSYRFLGELFLDAKQYHAGMKKLSVATRVPSPISMLCCDGASLSADSRDGAFGALRVARREVLQRA